MSPAPTGAPHFDRPADAAAHAAGESAVIVSGTDGQQAATYAVAIARAAAATGRRVALGDLAGGLAPIYALAGGEDAAGLAECFRDGRPLSEVARPVADTPTLFVLPAGNVANSPGALSDHDRWDRLIRGFGEAGGLLVLACNDRSSALPALAAANAGLLYAGRPSGAPGGVRLIGTVGAARPSAPGTRRAAGRRWWVLAAAGTAAVALAGWIGVAWVRLANAPDGTVIVAPHARIEPAAPAAAAAAAGAAAAGARTTSSAADTVTIEERTPPADRDRLAPFAIRVVATNTSANANSVLRGVERDAVIGAATIAVVARRAGPGRTARWHEVMFGAWRAAAAADSALAAVRRSGVVPRDAGTVIRVPYAVLLADRSAPERARAVLEVWRAKGVAPYALRQDDGTQRVYAGAFETVAQAVTMAAMIHAAGGAAIVAYRTGRPD